MRQQEISALVAAIRAQPWAILPEYLEAIEAIAVRALDSDNGFRGGRMRGVFFQNARDSREGGSNEAERPFRVSLDFTTHWRA